MRAILPMALLMLATAGCQMTVPFNTAPSREGTTRLVLLEGIATYRQRIALPPDATLIVRVQDVSLADAPAMLIAEKRLPTEGRQVPLPYAIEYDPARILPNHRITVSGRIEDGQGKLLWITDTAIPLPAAGDRADLLLVQVSG
ncbi:YbaY family lipoprotein [Sphingomonas sp. KC8]|uniref:YbaY family lipoprotein n=1 Tax=Sphingomonas sp. KC8 TaxID=1030157 RepID=UPI00024886B1|nr:YbaY family lipoprotein [Sphingomonas sp. KC8]ARS27117.1 lipoprotein-like protein [Sphingomonas sp. KC8]